MFTGLLRCLTFKLYINIFGLAFRNWSDALILGGIFFLWLLVGKYFLLEVENLFWQSLHCKELRWYSIGNVAACKDGNGCDQKLTKCCSNHCPRHFHLKRCAGLPGECPCKLLCTVYSGRLCSMAPSPSWRFGYSSLFRQCLVALPALHFMYKNDRPLPPISIRSHGLREAPTEGTLSPWPNIGSRLGPVTIKKNIPALILTLRWSFW